jgi:membrane-associated phospholipid phosphatase
MNWLLSLEESLFWFIHRSLANPAFDWLMPQLASNALFLPCVLIGSMLLIWHGGPRARVFTVLLLLSVAIGDGLVCNSLKQLVGRQRPFEILEGVKPLVGQAGLGESLPSAHAANWFAGAMICLLYFPRWARLVIPLAALVAFSRVYNGVHFPSDVLAGALLGAGTATAVAVSANALWNRIGPRWFAPQWKRLPSLLNPILQSTAPDDSQDTQSAAAQSDRRYLILGYILVAIFLVARLIYLASGKIELSEDEAYQWLWSKHLALAYYSKPPLIAIAHLIGTSLWGDNAFGVRFLPPFITAILSVLLLRFVAREANARAAFWLVPVMSVVPMMTAGALMMTIDSLSVCFWTLAMLCGWRAVQRDSTAQWLLCGLWMGLGFLSKAVALFQLLCWVVFFVLHPPSRSQLRRPGPWLALLVNALCTLPVLIWNAQHGWITASHLANRGGLDQKWNFEPRFLFEFIGAELGLLHPIFLILVVWAAVAFWKNRPRSPLLVYAFSMGAPLFLFYLLYTVRARVQPNWIVPAIIPLFMLAAVYWEQRYRDGLHSVKTWLIAGLAFGAPVIIVFHDTNLVRKLTTVALPVKADPLRRVREGSGLARVVGTERARLAAEGKPAFIIGGHYGLVGLLSFYLPEARAVVKTDPLVFYQSSDVPLNQFYFWPGYGARKGQNAIYVSPSGIPSKPPARLVGEFAEVRDLGMRDVEYRGRVMRRVQLFECRELR